jgi:glycosyltransferase involved in cell wall biosynthesis
MSGMHLGYLSGAPRVSTRPEAELAGPRAHILGVINAFRALSWDVHPFIAGDRVPRYWITSGSEQAISKSWWRTLATDMLRLTMGARNACKARRELEGKVEWVYERFAVMQALGRALQQQGVPWVLETNALLFHEAKADRHSVFLSGLARYQELKAYQQCDVLVCVSETLKQLIVELGIDANKIIVVPNGVDTELYNPCRQDAHRCHHGFTIGFLGGLSPWQALDLLLEAIHELRGQGCDNLRLTIVGDGPARQAWEDKAAQLGLDTAVVFTGRVPPGQVAQYIAGFDVGYSGPVQLGVGKMYLSPLKLYEYMAMAKPVVAAAFEDARRLVAGKDTGFLFQPGDKEDLKRALWEAYTKRLSLPAMGQQSRAEIVAHHSWIARVRYLIGKVEHVINGS